MGNLSSTGKGVINPKLTWNQRRKMTGLLNEYEATFDEKPGKTDFCEHIIDTGGAISTKSRRWRLPPRWEGEINQQLDELLSQRLCRSSNSAWASNVVLVSKKDGRQRFAIDYRRLNEVTKKDAYSIPQNQSIYLGQARRL